MKQQGILFAFLFFISIIASSQKTKEKNPDRSKDKQDVIASLNSKYVYYKERAMKIWNYAEVGFKEEKSTALLQQTLKENGFIIQPGVAEIPTAFVATYGSGSPVIGILGEFDALPGLSQKTEPTKDPLHAGNPGHGCGHNLFGTASLGAAIAVKELMAQGKFKGTIKFFGTPAEEKFFGKLWMARA